MYVHVFRQFLPQDASCKVSNNQSRLTSCIEYCFYFTLNFKIAISNIGIN